MEVNILVAIMCDSPHIGCDNVRRRGESGLSIRGGPEEVGSRGGKSSLPIRVGGIVGEERRFPFGDFPFGERWMVGESHIRVGFLRRTSFTPRIHTWRKARNVRF